jgi:hypothetical protein
MNWGIVNGGKSGLARRGESMNGGVHPTRVSSRPFASPVLHHLAASCATVALLCAA